MKRFLLLALLSVLLGGGVAYAQPAVRMGKHTITPEPNLRGLRTQRLRGATVELPSEAQANGRYFALVQFDALPTAAERGQMAGRGVRLLDYVGSNAYMVSLEAGAVTTQFRGTSASALVPLRGEWKVEPLLYEEKLPDWVHDGDGLSVKVVVRYFPVGSAYVLEALRGLGYTPRHHSELFRTVELQVLRRDLDRLASQAWVAGISPVPAPQDLYNSRASVLNRSNVLHLPALVGGRGLTGKGVHVGVWDGNVEQHPDFGHRLHQQEYEISVKASASHGVHVAGSLAGGGLLNPRARGMAPGAQLYTFNFNKSSNGLAEHEEMVKARHELGISISSNSYGLWLDRLCAVRKLLSYNAASTDMPLDELALMEPKLTLVFAAGNDYGSCGLTYGTVVRRVKNALYVGALKSDAGRTNFSSWGPQDDGRLAPMVSTMGEEVLSTVAKSGYETMSGTSMATPVVSGVLALLTERYHQLNRGEDPLATLLRGVVMNTADELDELGPDYRYGYGSVNAERAVEVIEKGWYLQGAKLGAGATPRMHPIVVPSGVSRLRVMITWNDTVASKSYVWGESPLINDLDLQLEHAGKFHQPWVLDPSAPNRPAYRGIDRLNNMEQVTIENPAPGLYNASVLPARVASSGQEYTLTWYFDRDETRITYPNGGEKLAPGDTCQVRWYGHGKASVDLSVDGGVTYRTLVDTVERGVATLALPTDLPNTGRALMRVRTSLGSDVSDAPFILMHRPRKLDVSVTECLSGNWRLTWSKAKGEVTEYKVLRANAALTGYDTVATLDATKSMYDIPLEQSRDGLLHLYTVVAVGPDGIRSERAEGIHVHPKMPLRLTPEVSSFEELFRVYPSPYVIVPTGKSNRSKLHVHYAQQEPGITAPGSHVLNFDTHDMPDVKIWPSGQLPTSMDPEVNKNLIPVRICNIDLTQMAGRKVFLSIDKTHLFKGSPFHSIFMLKVNGQPFAEQGGKTVVHGNEGTKTVQSNYDLSAFAGGNVSIEMICGVRNAHADELSINRIKLFEPVETSDIYLAKMILPESSAELAYEQIGVTVVNDGHRQVENALLRYRVNDGAEQLLTLPVLLPYERKDVMVPQRLDFTTKEALGQRFDVYMEVLDPDDSNKENNAIEGHVLNYGSVVRMPASQLIKGFLGTYPSELFRVHQVTEPVVFTDHAGPFGDYLNSQRGTIHFLPSTPGKVIEMTFKSLDTEQNEDILGIYTRYEHVDLRVAVQGYGNIPAAILSGTLKDGEPLTFVSRNPDGAVCAVFRSSSSLRKPGWIAEVREVDQQNLYSLLSVTYDKTFSPEGHVPITFKVRNNSKQRMTNVQVAYILEGTKDKRVETIPVIEPESEVDYTFSAKALVKPAHRAVLYGGVVQDDYDTSDNALSVVVVNDRYCSDRSYEQAGNRIKEVSDAYTAWEDPDVHQDVHDEEAHEEPLPHTYATETEFSLFKRSRLASLKVRTEPISGKGFVLYAWIDWNDNGELEEGERISTPLTKGQRVAWLRVDIPETAVVGKLRMRLATAHELAGKPCGRVGLSGSSVDLTANVLDQEDPVRFDLAATTIMVASGAQLTEKEQVSVWVKNMTAYYSKPFEMGIKAGDNDVVWEKCEVEIPPYDSMEYVFEARFDLSKPGRHRIISGVRSDDNEDNNFTAVNAYCIRQVGEPFYALNFYENPKDVSDKREALLPGNFDGLDLRTTTYEAWVNLRETSLNNIFSGKGALVTTFNRPYSTLAPQHSFLVLVGDNLLFKTAGNVVRYGEWMHLAVTIDSEQSGSPTVRLYLNGEQVPLESKGSDRMKHKPDDNMLIAYRLEGSIDEVRIWNKVRTQDEIRKYMYKHAYPDFNMKSGLVGEFRLDEGPGNIITKSEKSLMAIYSSRVQADAPDCAWFVPDALLKGIEATGQTRPAAMGKDTTVTIHFSRSTDMSKVKLKLEPMWPHAKFAYNGQPVTADTEFDFTGGSVVLSPDGVELFGRKLSKSYRIVAVRDQSEECDLLSIAALRSNNPRLLREERIEGTVPQDMVLQLEGVADLSAVRLDFKLSDSAVLLYQGQPCVSGKTFFDFNRRVLLSVRSQNGLKYRHYTLRTVRSQSLALEGHSTELVYGDRASVGVSASSGLPVLVASSDPSVVTVSEGQLLSMGLGVATITALQPGNDVYQAAEPVSYNVEVKPRTLSVKPVDRTVPYAAPIPALDYEFDYAPASDLRQPLVEYLNREAQYRVYSGSEAWSGKDYLAVGTHQWKPGAASGLAFGPYLLVLNAGTLTISEQAHPVLRVTVKDASGTALSGVTVKINNLELLTGAEGAVSVALPKVADKIYRLEVTKAGFASVVEDIASLSGDASREITLHSLTLDVTFAADLNGKLFGERNQRLALHGATKPVYAIANRNYRFDKWSDGVMDNPRVVRDVTESLTLTAHFVEYKPLMTYKSQGGGTINGSVEYKQELDGSLTVTATPDPGFHFVTWSDGQLTPERTDAGFVTDQVFYAHFSRNRELPFLENFELEKKEPEGWLNRDLTGFGKWTIDSKYISSMGTVGSGNFASADSYSTGPSAIVSAELISPWIDISRTSGNLALEFDYKFQTIGMGIFPHEGLFVSYTVDGVNWTQVVRIFTEEAAERHAKFYISRSKLGAADRIRFRWHYTHTWDYYALFDNVSVTADKVSSFHLNYFAATGGKVKCAEELPALRNEGQKGPKVEAVPDDGYEFSHWTDGVATAEREDTQYTYVTAVFKLKPGTYHAVSYQSGEGGYVAGLTTQRILHATRSTPVKAHPSFGYRFTRWSDGQASAYRVEESVVKDISFTAEFEKLPTSKVTFNTPDSGRLEVRLSTGDLMESGGVCPVGDTVTLHFFPSPGYYTESVKVNGAKVALEAEPTCKVPVGAADVAIEVKYAPMAYVVTFVASKGGSIVGKHEQRVERGASASGVVAKPDDGFVFLMWSDGYDQAERTINAVWSNAEYTAHFIEKPYVLVSFATGGGTEVPPVSVRAGAAVAKPADPARIGYKFTGWSTRPADGKAYDFAQPVQASMTLYAQWESLEYTLSFDANGGAGSMKPVEGTHGVAFNLPACTFTRDGHTFIGWSYEPAGSVVYNDGTSVTHVLRSIGTTVTLYAQWVAGTLPKHKVTFVLAEDRTLVVSVVEGQRVQPWLDLAKPGYELGAWSADKKEPYDFTKPVSGDLTLYPMWAPLIYRVRPMAPFAFGVMPEQVFVYDEMQALRKNEFERPTYTFAGWSTEPGATTAHYTDEQAVSNLTDRPGQTIPLYAVWDEVTHTVTFNVRGGEDMAAVKVHSGTKMAEPAAPIRKFHHFMGWFSDEKLRHRHDFNLPVTEDMTLHAAWSRYRISYTLTLAQTENGSVQVMVGGEAISLPATLPIGTVFTLNITPNSGYRVKSVMVNGEAKRVDDQHTLEANTTVEVTFVNRYSAVEPTSFAEVSVYPNPFEGQLTVRGAESLVRVELFDATGACVRSEATKGSHEVHLQTQGLPSGLYLLRMHDAQGNMKSVRLLR